MNTAQNRETESSSRDREARFLLRLWVLILPALLAILIFLGPVALEGGFDPAAFLAAAFGLVVVLAIFVALDAFSRRYPAPVDGWPRLVTLFRDTAAAILVAGFVVAGVRLAIGSFGG